MVYRYFLLKTGYLNTKFKMRKKYINKILKTFPDIAVGRKNFDFFELRIKKNIELTKKFIKKNNKKKYINFKINL